MQLDHAVLADMIQQHRKWEKGLPDGQQLRLNRCIVDGYTFPKLHKVSFNYVTFRNCTFNNINNSEINDTTFRNCITSCCIVSSSTLRLVEFTDGDDIAFSKCTIQRLFFTRHNRHIRFTDSRMTGLNIRKSCLPALRFGECTMSDSGIAHTIISDFRTSGTDLHDLTINQSILQAYHPSCKVAQVGFTGHGTCGRMLTVLEADTGVTCHCGCFHGTVKALRIYMKDDYTLIQTRRKALNTALRLLACN